MSEAMYDRARDAIAVAERNFNSPIVEVDAKPTDCYHDADGAVWVPAWVKVAYSEIDLEARPK